MTNLKHIRFFAAAVAVVVLVGVSPVLADAIDGNWCNGVKRLEISGAKIVTPGGNRIDGLYGRHDFTYTVPAGEPGAGATVDMDLLDEDDLWLWPTGRAPDPAKAGTQMRKRCAAPVS
ncbi:unnamed protein product [Laminaria digitata]